MMRLVLAISAFLLLPIPQSLLACPFNNLGNDYWSENDEDITNRRRRLLEWHRKTTQDGGYDDDAATCGGKFCYGRITPSKLVPPFEMKYTDLVSIGLPNTNSSDFNYMEDSQARRNVLDGFDLNNDGPSGAAGYTYIGQFLSHDINLDETSILGVRINPLQIQNINTPQIDLDTLYNFNGKKSKMRNGKFILDGPMNRDFQRKRKDGTAIIIDERNDEHRIVSQLTVAFMTLHNKLKDIYGSRDKARKETIKTWQSIILTDLLPNLLDAEVLEEVRNPSNRRLYTGELLDQLLMPIEFSTAAYRLFHSRARGRYRLNEETDGTTTERARARLFDVGNDDEPNLVGGSILPTNLVVEWERFFFEPLSDGTTPSGANVARIMDMLYSRPIMRLPIEEAGTPRETIEVVCDDEECTDVCSIEGDNVKRNGGKGNGVDSTNCRIVDDITIRDSITASLAILDLVRGQTHGLPGGIAFAKYVRDVLNVPDLDVLSLDYMLDGNVFGLPDLDEGGDGSSNSYPYDDVPLLLYLAHESIRDHDGLLLGKLGSRIVAEVLYGLVQKSGDQISILDDDGEFDYESQITGDYSVSMMDVFDYISWV